MNLGEYQNNIKQLDRLTNLRYENIFKMYQLKTGQYFYNLQRAINFPDQLDSTQIGYVTVKQKQPWTTISYNIYGTTELWWVICLLNKIENPVLSPDIGTVLKILNPTYLKNILNEISTSLQ